MEKLATTSGPYEGKLQPNYAVCYREEKKFQNPAGFWEHLFSKLALAGLLCFEFNAGITHRRKIKRLIPDGIETWIAS